MKTIYISGPLTGVSNITSLKNFYEQIGNICFQLGMQPYIPHKHSDPILHRDLLPETIYRMDRDHISNSDWVVAYVGSPAVGVGQEIEIARECNIPVILLYETGRTISRMVRGNPTVKAEVTGDDLEGILLKLELTMLHLCCGHSNFTICQNLPA